MAAYDDIDGFRNRTTMPAEYVDELEVRHPGWLAITLEDASRWIDARLRKRYVTPFPAPVSTVVKGWLAKIVTVRCFIKRGVNPTDEQFDEIRQEATDAKAEIQEAADAEKGLFDLPLLESADPSAIARPATRSYTEASPYVHTTMQGARGRDEDRSGGGSYG